MRRTGLLLICLIAIYFAYTHAQAALIKAVKGKKVLVDMQKDSLKSGDILKVEDQNGKAVGLVKITKTKGNLAEGLFKGKVEKGFTAKLRPPGAAKNKSGSVKSVKQFSDSENGKSVYGVIIGYNSAKADIQLQNANATVSLTGTGFSLKGLIDYSLFQWLGFRGLIGLEQFNVGGVNNSECDGECTAEINYLAFDFWGRALFGQGSGFRPWFGAGFDLMFPMSKDATALDKKSITNTSLIAIGGGFDWMMSDTSYIPLQFEYNLYPSSEEVKANAMTLRIGFAKTW